jgi:NAD kinase
LSSAENRKIVLITRPTRLDELIARYQTLGQAKFYLEHLGADFADYLRENEAYTSSLRVLVQTLQSWGRYQIIDRAHLTNYIFAADDIVITLGQDGMVANTLKYLNGQPLVGVNPEPKRWDGILLPFEAAQVASILPGVANDGRTVSLVTMAEVTLSDGQVLRGVNDVFIGSKTHTSALYEIEFQGIKEAQSSSGLIVSTGLGSTAWLKSIVTGSIGIADAIGHSSGSVYLPMARDADHLVFAVREPFASRASQTALVYGEVKQSEFLTLRSRMPDNGVIFSDGMEADFLQFTAGMEAKIGVCATKGVLVG